nr:hypothetical protein [uncultured Carboxylicivirga sp.]
MNILFKYLFRDDGNYKTFSEVVFSNQNNAKLDMVLLCIEARLIEGAWFDPDLWQIPRFGFHKANTFGMDDYLWYEFDDIAWTANNTKAMDISEWLKVIGCE